MIDWTDVLIAGVGLVFTAILIPLIKAGFAWLKNKTKNEALLAALTEAEKVADNVVASLQANVVNGLKAESEDGKLSPEDIKMVTTKAISMFISDVSCQTRDTIMNNADDIQAWIKNLIESRLAILKK